MRVAVVGIGAMGCLFGAKLSRVTEVMLVGHWPAQLAALRETGLRFIDLNGRTHTVTLPVLDEPEPAAPVDLALILVKSSQTRQSARVASRLLTKNGLALTLQNGLGNLEQLAGVLGERRANLGITSEGAAVLQPGVVQHAGTGHTFIAKQPTATLDAKEIVALFQAAGFQTSLAEDAMGLVWGKLAINAGINPITALLRVHNGFLANNDLACSLMQQAAREVATVAAAQKIQLPFSDAAAEALSVARATAANRSSMWQDIAQGRPTEIGAICGAVVEYGRRFGVATPLNQILLNAVQQAERENWPGDQTAEATLAQLAGQYEQASKATPR